MAQQVDKREEGLRALARMIARAYLRDTRDKSNNKQFLDNENQGESKEENDGNKGSV